MALGLAVRAFTKAATYLWSKPMTLGTAATVASIPVATAILDHETDGALSQAAYQSAIGSLKEKVKEGASPEAIERTMDGIGYIAAITNRLDKFAQNVTVLEIMQQNEGPDAIQKGKAAAVAYQLKPDNLALLVAKQGMRTAIADDLFKGDRNAADKYLANSLVNDVVKNAQVHALEGHQVTREDVRHTVTDIINNPDQHPVSSKFFSDRGRLMNGLKQVWPELSTPEPRANAKVGQEGFGLRDAFGMAADGEGGMMKMFAFVMAMLMQALGLGKGLANDPAGKPAEQNMRTPEDGYERPSLRPTPAPALRPGF